MLVAALVSYGIIAVITFFVVLVAAYRVEGDYEPISVAGWAIILAMATGWPVTWAFLIGSIIAEEWRKR